MDATEYDHGQSLGEGGLEFARLKRLTRQTSEGWRALGILTIVLD
jgi:hypothetical protein